MSPNSQRIKKAQQRLAQDAAFNELMMMHAANCGKKRYGDIKSIVEKYQKRGHQVERCHLEYRLELKMKGRVMKNLITSAEQHQSKLLSPMARLCLQV